MMPTPQTWPRLAARAVAAVAVVLVLGLPALAAPPVEDDFKYFPPDSDLVAVMHMDRIIASEPVRKMTRDVPDFGKGLEEMKKQFGVAPADIERLGIGGRVKDEGLFV